MKTKYGRIHKVENKEKKFGANSTYNYVRIKSEMGQDQELLLTDSQLQQARSRALKHPEDCGKRISLKEWLKR